MSKKQLSIKAAFFSIVERVINIFRKDNPKKVDTAIVGFIDILGYKDLVKRKKNNIKTIFSIENSLKKSSVVIEKIKLKKGEYRKYYEKVLNALDIKIISDSIIFTLNLGKIKPSRLYKDNENLSNHIFTFFSAIMGTCPFFIGKTGCILRGGISIGSHYENNKDKNFFIFSEAFINACEKEKEQKNKTRIALDEKLLEYLRSISFSYMGKHLEVDQEDGAYYIDIYGFLNQDAEMDKHVFKDIRNGITLNIIHNLLYPKPNKNDIIEKLKYFMRYHNRKMQERGLESFKIDDIFNLSKDELIRTHKKIITET